MAAAILFLKSMDENKRCPDMHKRLRWSNSWTGALVANETSGMKVLPKQRRVSDAADKNQWCRPRDLTRRDLNFLATAPSGVQLRKEENDNDNQSK